jgi:hypothetical protein
MAALLGGLLAAAPAPARAAAAGCDTASASSPGPLQVHVVAAGCGDWITMGRWSAVLRERATGIPVGSWSVIANAPGVVALVDQTVAVPGAGWYDFVVENRTNSHGPDQSIPLVVYDGGLVTITPPHPEFRTGTLGSHWAVTLRWTRIGAAAVSKYQVQRRVDGGAYATLGATTKTSFATSVAAGHYDQYRVRAVNSAGKAGPWRSSDVVLPDSQQEDVAIDFAGPAWRTATGASYWGGHALTASVSGRAVETYFAGHSYAIVSAVGPTHGSFRVYVDGSLRATVSTYAKTAAYRKIVYAMSWSAWNEHLIRLVVVGTPGHPRVDFDGVIRLTGAKE